MIVSLALISLSVLLGLIVLHSFCPDLNLSLKLAVGPSLGLGMSSGLFFLCLLIVGEANLIGIVLELLIVLLCGVKIWRGQTSEAPTLIEKPPSSWSKLTILLGLVFLTLFSMTLISAVYHGLAFPHGTYDASAIWNVSGRILALSGQEWHEAYRMAHLAHADYPLLIPGMNARIWVALDHPAAYVPMIQNGIIYLSFLGLFISVLALLRGLGMGLFAGILVLCSPILIDVSIDQFADVPLAFFMFLAAVFLVLQDKAPNCLRLSVIAGFAAGMALWTKNEGSLFLLVVAFIRSLVVWKERGFKEMFKQGSCLVLGCLPFLFLLLFFKLQYAPSNDLVAGQSSSTLDRIADWDRYLIIGRAFTHRFLFFGGGQVGVLPMFMGVVIVFGFRKDWNRSSIQSLVGIIALLCLGYFTVYLTTPMPLEWHLDFSLRRIFLHVWPLILLLGLLLMSSVTDIEKSLFRGLEGSKEEPGEE